MFIYLFLFIYLLFCLFVILFYFFLIQNIIEMFFFLFFFIYLFYLLFFGFLFLFLFFHNFLSKKNLNKYKNAILCKICCYILFASWMHIIHNFFSSCLIIFLWNDKHIYILTSFYYSLKIHTQTHFKKEITSYKIIYLGICHFKVYYFILIRILSYNECLLHLIVYTSVHHCSVKYVSYSCCSKCGSTHSPWTDSTPSSCLQKDPVPSFHCSASQMESWESFSPHLAWVTDP